MFCVQDNQFVSPAVPGTLEKLNELMESPRVRWKIETIRSVREPGAIRLWASNTDFQKFCIKEGLKKKGAGEAFKALTDEEKLGRWATALKESLPPLIFGARDFDETPLKKDPSRTMKRRVLAGIHLSGLFMFDVDHVDNPLEVYEMWKKNEGLVKRTALVHITSSKKGIRFVFTANIKDGNLADNQIVFAQTLGYKADQSCIDATRNSFAPKEEDILYINEELLFDYYDEKFDKEFTPQYREKKTQPLNHQFPVADGADSIVRSKSSAVASEDAGKGSATSGNVDVDASGLKWKGYDVQSIIDLRYGDKLPCAADSNRHNESLKLASDLLVLFDGDKQKTLAMLKAQKWVQEIIDERDENVEQTVSSAAQRMAEREKKYLSQLPSKAMQDAIKEATGKTYQEITQAKMQASAEEGDIERWLWEWGEQIEALMPDFPLLRDICKGLKRNQYPAAMFVAGGLMMTLMTRCTYRFYHRPEELRRLNNSTLIIGDPASGKSFATRLFKLLAAPIVAADKVGKDAINAYREQMRTKGANKEKPKKPKVVVRVHPARTSNAQFIQDMVNSVENVDGEDMQLHMLTFDTELDNTVTIQKGGSWIDKQSLELKAFHNEEDGQAYSNNDSILQDFYVTWNFIYTGTPIALKKKVNEQNFGSGLATRLTVIPLPSTNFEMMSREQNVDFESDGRLKEWAFKLDRMKGLLSLDKIVDELYDWTARRMADAKENDSKADEMLCKRCAYHGLNFAAPFIVMRHWANIHQNGQYWSGEFETDDVDWKLTELLVTIQYACQRHYFLAMAEKYFDDQLRDVSVNTHRQQKTIDAFERLPEEFTVDEAMRCFSLSNDTVARVKISRLMKDHFVEKAGDFVENGTTKSVFKKTGRVMR